jgi:hypothetical protein
MRLRRRGFSTPGRFGGTKHRSVSWRLARTTVTSRPAATTTQFGCGDFSQPIHRKMRSFGRKIALLAVAIVHGSCHSELIHQLCLRELTRLCRLLRYRVAVQHRSPGSAAHRGAAVVGRATLGIRSIGRPNPEGVPQWSWLCTTLTGLGLLDCHLPRVALHGCAVALTLGSVVWTPLGSAETILGPV